MRIPVALLLIFFIAACRAPEQGLEQSVKPGINASFVKPDLDVDTYVQKFEGESREIFVARHRIARAIVNQLTAIFP